MEIGCLPVDLGKWDQARGDALVVPLWSDVRPLRGAAGLLDWRLCGKLSAWIDSGRLAGVDNEQTLFPAGKRLTWRSVLALGMGPWREFSETNFRAAVGRAVEAMRGLHLRKVAMALPGREGDRVSPRRAIEIVIDVTAAAPLDEILLIEPPAAQKEMAEFLRKRGLR